MPLPLLLETIERLPAFTRLANSLPAPGERRRIAGLPGSADATAIAALAERVPGRFLVIVAETLPDAERWFADLPMYVVRRSASRSHADP